MGRIDALAVGYPSERNRCCRDSSMKEAILSFDVLNITGGKCTDCLTALRLILP